MRICLQGRTQGGLADAPLLPRAVTSDIWVANMLYLTSHMLFGKQLADRMRLIIGGSTATYRDIVLCYSCPEILCVYA